MGISVFLQQIPCWAELCELLSTMNDKEIHDLLTTAWDYGTCIAWGQDDYENGGITQFIPWNDKNKNKTNAENKNKIAERLSIALKYIHDKKLNGDYIERDIDIQLKCGGKNGKYWKLKTKDCSYTVTYGKLYNNSPFNSNTMNKSFSSSVDCYKEAQKKLKEKKKKKYKVDWDKSSNSKNNQYNDEYLKLSKAMDEAIKMSEIKTKQFADIIHKTLDGLFHINICNVISIYCNEHKIDHYDCDKCFDDIGSPHTPIARLLQCVKSPMDKAPSSFDIHLFEGIFGNGQQFGEDVCYGSIRVFSPKEMKLFATRMINRLFEDDGGDEVKDIIFGVEELNVAKNINKKRKNTDSLEMEEPALKKRKLNDMTKVESVKKEELYEDDIIYKVSYALSASGIFDKKKQDIIWRKIFRLNSKYNKIPQNSYEGNHSLCALCFGLNAAAMNRGVIAHYW